METRAELNARLMLAGMPKGLYARLLGQLPSVVSRHGDSRPIPGYGASIIRAWEIMTPEQRHHWLESAKSC